MERNFKLSDVPLFCRGYTLYPVCERFSINTDLAESILIAMNISVGSIGKDGVINQDQIKVYKEDPVLPEIICEEHFFDKNQIKKCLEAGLIKEQAGKYEVTSKMFDILEYMKKRKRGLNFSTSDILHKTILKV